MNTHTQWDQNPMMVIWEATRACALSCKYCRAELTSTPDPNELNAAEASAFIEQVARAKPQIFMITGGDPMYRRDLVRLIDQASKLKLKVAMNPSATPRFLKADMKTLREAGLHSISLGLDGASKTSHDAFRGLSGGWDWTMQGFKAAAAAGLGVQINTTITSRNIGELNSFVQLMNMLHPAAWNIYPIVPLGRMRVEHIPTARQMENFLARVDQIASEATYEIRFMEGPHFRRVAQQRHQAKGGTEPKFDAVNDGNGLVFVSNTGDIWPGQFLPVPTGNVRKEELVDVYRTSPVFQKLRDPDQLKGKCRQCEYRFVCGGSRARAYAVMGDYLAQDPLCIYEPKESAAPQSKSGGGPAPIWRMYLDD